MANENGNQITVVTYADEDLSRGPKDLISVALNVTSLHIRFREFLEDLYEIIGKDEDSDSPFQLEEIEFSAEITAEGDFKLLGVGASASTTGAIKFVHKRVKEDSGMQT